MAGFLLSSTLMIFLTNGLITSSELTNIYNSHVGSCNRTCEYPPKPRLCEYDFTVSWSYSMSGYCLDCPLNAEQCDLTKCVTVDGTCRPIIVTNEITPGPSIQVCKGDTVRVKVTNDLQDHGGLSVHWHGMNQFGTNMMDGVSMITQCPIARSSSFVYKFLADPAGTHWWHSHTGLHRGDGMYGSLIVREPMETEINSKEYDLDLPEHVIQLVDWTSDISFKIFALSIDRTDLNLETTVTILINGKGRQVEFTDGNGNTAYTPLTEFEVEEGMRYRMRVINSAFGECNEQIVIESHPVNIIASDGYAFRTIENVDAFHIGPGERLDFVLTASAPPSTYCIYVYGLLGNMCKGVGSAILRYKNAPKTTPNCTSNPIVDTLFTTLNSGQLLPMVKYFSLYDTYTLDPVDPDLYNVDEKYYIELFEYVNDILDEDGMPSNLTDSDLQIDHVKFKFPNKPLLTTEPIDVETCHPNQDRTLYNVCSSTMCECTNVLKIKLGQVVEFIIVNTVNFIPHPMHMHGHSFNVLAQENLMNATLADIMELDNEGKLPRLPLESSVVKDTVNVPMNGYTIIRWKADNPGYWYFHCHVDYHSEAGMTMVIQVGDDDEIPKPPKGVPRCGPWSPD